MTDRELLEAAARAAGIEFGPKRAATGGPHLYLGPQGGWWNPLADDGDALRLAVRLRLSLLPFPDGEEVCVQSFSAPPMTDWVEPVGTDPYAATRRAIVRAAAALDKKDAT